MAYHWMGNVAIMENADELRRLMLEGNQEEAEKVMMQLETMMMKADSEDLRAQGVDLGRVCTVCHCYERFQDKTDECCWKILKKKCVFEEATRDREQTSGSDGTDHRQAPSRPTRGKNVNRWKRAVNRWKRAVAADLDAKSQHYSPESGSAIATGSACRE